MDEEEKLLAKQYGLKPAERVKYGVIWEPLGGHAKPDWLIEKEVLAAPAHAKPRGWMGEFHHLKEFISHIWGRKNDLFYVEWNPNALAILDAFCKHQITSVASHASGGKSHIFAAIGTAKFFVRPVSTKVLVTSYTKQAAQGRIWGDIQNCWTVAEQFFKAQGLSVPGRFLQGKSLIRYEIGAVKNPKAGLELLAGEATETSETTNKIQGYKSDTIIVIGDEWSSMPIAVYNDVMSNLRANPDSKLLAGFNPSTYHDPGGLISRPVGGWSKVTQESDRWETQVGGCCLHFDGERSPNVIDPKARWKGLLDRKMLAEMRAVFPKGTKRDDQMVRGWWSQTGAKQAIYDEADIENFGADRPERRWIGGGFTYVAGLDIGNAHGGDRTVLTMGRAGLAKSDAGETHVVCELVETLILNENMELNDSLSEQIVARVKREMQDGVWGAGTVLAGQKRVIPAANLAVDCTGGGTHFAALLARDIGSSFIQVGFGEKASDRRVAKNDKRLGHEAFANKVSELWGVPVQLIRTSQIRGLGPDLIHELTIRTYKDDAAKRMQVESKDDMKKRTNGQSPDVGDSWACMVEAARVRGGLSSSEKAAVLPQTPVNRERLRRQQEEFFGAAEATDYRMGGWGE
jgi:hypothetical protein